MALRIIALADNPMPNMARIAGLSLGSKQKETATPIAPPNSSNRTGRMEMRICRWERVLSICQTYIDPAAKTRRRIITDETCAFGGFHAPPEHPGVKKPPSRTATWAQGRQPRRRRMPPCRRRWFGPRFPRKAPPTGQIGPRLQVSEWQTTPGRERHCPLGQR